MPSIARKNLLEDIPRFLVAQAGIIFAVTLVTIQTGILNGFSRSTTLLIQKSQADIWISSEEMVHFDLTEPILFEQLAKARQVKGVERAEALIRGVAEWDVPQGDLTTVKVLGFDPQGQLFVPGNLTQGKLSALNEPYTIILDETNLNNLKLNQLGNRAEIGSLPAQLVGLTQDTQSIVSDEFVFTSLESANAYLNSGITTRLDCQWKSGDIQCNNIYKKSLFNSSTEDSPVAAPEPLNSNTSIAYILIKAKPGQEIEELKKRLDIALYGTLAYTRTEMAQKTRNHWVKRTGIGFILGLGAAVGVIVGMVIVGQILYASVSDHLKEFGTLKAMGASDWVIYGVIVEQALWMAVLGYIPGMVLCWGVSAWTLASQGIVILITPVTAVGVFGLTLVMCVSSALFAIQKVTRVDPGIVFKA
ncbi:MAG: FtsX-like permease family protein [Moorea sp. SIO2B7]|nr:FtsX-like permease family protein [Moorena sp. SIO2B7]